MKSILLIIILNLFVIVTKAQDVLFYTSIQGTWDKDNNSNRSQFAGNNKRIYNYFSQYARLLVSGKENVNDTEEITFRVNEKGDIDSFKVEKSIDHSYDEIMKEIILSMSGKWRPGERDSIKISETIKIWIHIYKSKPLRMNLDEYLMEGEKLYEEKDYKKALDCIDQALKYDELNSKAMLLKYKILLAQNNKEEACRFLNSCRKYQINLLSALNECE